MSAGRNVGLRQPGLRRAMARPAEGGSEGGDSTGGVGGTSTASIERILETRGQFLTSSAGLTWWHDPFVVLPGTRGSCWRDLHPVDVHIINDSPGGVCQVASNTGFGLIVVDPSDTYPYVVEGGPSIAGELSAAQPFYMFVRFRLVGEPDTGGPGGWVDGQNTLVIGLVDPTTLGVVGVGLAIGEGFFGAVGGHVNNEFSTTGIPSTVARDFGVWHTAELYTAAGKWWLKMDDGTPVDVSSLFPGTAVHGTPFVEVIATGVLQPAVDLDHIAFGAARNGAIVTPLGPDPGGVSAVTATFPFASSGGATPDISMPGLTTLGGQLLLETPGGAPDGRALLGLGTMATQNADAVAITGGTLTGLPAPTSGSDAATKSYVDALAAGLKWKAPVRAASAVNFEIATLEDGVTMDGVLLTTGDRVLLRAQDAPAENGVYVVPPAGPAARSSDADSSAELVSAVVAVEEGATLADSIHVCTTNAPINVGVTAITWSSLPSATGALLAGNNLSDVADGEEARINLGLVAIASSGSASDLMTGTVPAARLGNALLRGNNLSDLPAAATARANLGLGSSAVESVTLFSRTFVGPDVDFFAPPGTTWQLVPALGAGMVAVLQTTGWILVSKSGSLTGAPSLKMGTNGAHDNLSNPLTVVSAATLNSALVGYRGAFGQQVISSTYLLTADLGNPITLEITASATAAAAATYVVRPFCIVSGLIPFP